MLSPLMEKSIKTVKACACATGMQEAVSRSFDSLFIAALTELYASHGCPSLEYCGPAIFPYTTIEMRDLDRVQRNSTRQVGGLRGTNYEGRLRLLKLYPFSYRRLRGNLICLENSSR